MTGTTTPRMSVFTTWPEGRMALASVGAAKGVQGVPLRLLELLRLYCSVINSCGFCIAMHSEHSRAQGVSEDEIDALKNACLSGQFSDGDLSALVLAERMTRLDDDSGLARAVETAKAHFDAQQLSVISYQIAAINAWNRLAIADGLEKDHFKPSSRLR